MYHRGSNTFRHYNSMRNSRNRQVAKSVAAAAAHLLCSDTGHDGSCTTAKTAAQTATTQPFPGYVNIACSPQQTNGYDCGVYVLALVDLLCNWHQQGLNLTQQEHRLADNVTSSYVTAFRQQLLEVVMSKASQ
eukprot:jgi/Chrzof1/14485/Cz09g04160.t1